VSFEVQVYLKKLHRIEASGGSDEISVFQLDGKGGLNASPNANYRYQLQGLGRMEITQCVVYIDAPRELDFGTVYSNVTPGVVATKDLNVTATKSSECKAGAPLGVTLMFSPVDGQISEGGTALSMENGLYFSIKSNGTKIPFNTSVGFWDDVNSSNQKVVNYRAEINARNALKEGVVNKSIVLNVNYI
jgi:type 1 fimbria pilin